MPSLITRQPKAVRWLSAEALVEPHDEIQAPIALLTYVDAFANAT